MMKLSNAVRKLNDTSWLAQIIQDKIDVEFNKNGPSSRWGCLQTLHNIVNEADDTNNTEIYYDNFDGKRMIIIRSITSYELQCKLLGLAQRYTDDEGQYIVSVLTTNDLNSATIKDISELMYQMQ